jgi:hypothetical protein
VYVSICGVILWGQRVTLVSDGGLEEDEKLGLGLF